MNTKQNIIKRENRPIKRILLLLGAYYRNLQDGVTRYAKEQRWTLDLSYVRGGLLKYTFRLDGIVGLLTNPHDLKTLQQLPALPVVDLSAAFSKDAISQNGASAAYVLSDNALIGRMAAEHFIGLGFRHIALLNIGNYWMEKERKEPFMAAVKEAERTYHELKYYQWEKELGGPHSSVTDEQVLRKLEEALQRLPKPVGIFTPSDDQAVVILQACDEAGLRVPEEIAVLGCHNMQEICESAPVPLSSLDDNLELQGYEAARLLHRMMDGETPPEEPIRISPKGIVVRTSTDILAVPHVEVAKALRFIWEHFDEAIQVEDVAGATCLSRRSLTRLFQQHLNRSVGSEISRKRIEHAQKLLIETDYKAWEIAEMSGFSSMEHLSKAFTRIVGAPPSTYRQNHQKSGGGM